MAVSLFAENYLPCVDPMSGLIGVQKKTSGGKLTDVLPSLNRAVAVARCYGRLYLMMVPALGNGSMVIASYNRKYQYNGLVDDVRFALKGIYVHEQDRNGNMHWNLLNSELQLVKSLADFNFPAVNDARFGSYYVNSPSVIFVGADGEKYKLNIESAEVEKVVPYIPKHLRPVVEEEPVRFYDISVNYRKNSIKVNPTGRNTDSNIAIINNIANYENLFNGMLGMIPNKDTREVEVGRHTEEEVVAYYNRVPVELAEKFIKIVSTVKSRDDALHIMLMSKYVKETLGVKPNTTEYIDKLYEGLTTGFTSITNKDVSKDRTYLAKVLVVGDALLLMVKTNTSNRIVSTVSQLGIDRVMPDEDVVYLSNCEKQSGKSGLTLDIKACRVNLLGDMKIPMDFIPRSIANNKDAHGRIKEFDYDFKAKVTLAVEVADSKDARRITLNTMLFDIFNYIPKRKTTDKNIVYSSKTNDTFVKLF